MLTEVASSLAEPLTHSEGNEPAVIFILACQAIR